MIEEAPIPPEVDAAVRTAYAGMGGTLPVAVRSSATAEDLPFASFAGQQDSYLDVVGADAVVEAVRRCWASLWSDRAVAYRVRQRDQQPRRRARRRRPGHGRRRHGRRAVHRKPRHRDPDGDGHQREPGHGAGRGLGSGQPGPVRAGHGDRRGQASNAGRDGARTRPGPGRAPAAGTHGAGRRASSASSGRRRTSNGRSTPPARSGSPSHARSPRCIRCPKPAPEDAGAARPPAPGCTSAAPCSRG